MADRFVEPARKLLLDGKHREAEALLSKSDDPWILVHRADLLLLRSPFDRAVVEQACTLYRRAAKAYPALAEASIARAEAMLEAAPDPVTETLQEVFGRTAFAPRRRKLVDALCLGRHALAVAPEDGDVHLLYELPSQLLEGKTLLVSRRRRPTDAVSEAPVIPVGAAEEGSLAQLSSFRNGPAKLLVLPPETLLLPSTVEALASVRIDLLVIDEAHRASDLSPFFDWTWSGVREAIARLTPRSVLALSTNATPQVRNGLVERLGLVQPELMIESFDRPSVFFAVTRSGDRPGTIATALRETAGGALVFTLREREAEELAAALRDAGVSAAPLQENPIQLREWEQGRTQVLVVSNPSELSVRRRDVRAVFHAYYPRSIEDYVEQVAYAGIDGEPARAILFYHPEDQALHRDRLDREYPDHAVLEETVRRLRAEVAPSEVNPAALRLLEERGLLRRVGRDRVEFLPDAPPVGRLDLTEVERRQRQAEERLHAVVAYAEGRACRRRTLLEYFGERPAAGWKCDGCDRCRSLEAGETKRSPEARKAVLDAVRELESRRMTATAMARAIMFLGKGMRGLTETDIRELLHALVRDGAVTVVPQGQWLRVKR